MILVLKMTKKYHITWYWCQNIRDNMVEKRVKKFGQGPPPFFGQCPKEIDFCYGRCSLISVDSPAYGCLEANPSGKVYVFICLFIFHSLNQSAHPLILTWTQVECREDTRDTCVLEEVIDPRMITDGRDGTTVSKMWKHVKNVKVKVIQVMDPQIIRDERDGSPLWAKYKNKVKPFSEAWEGKRRNLTNIGETKMAFAEQLTTITISSALH